MSISLMPEWAFSLFDAGGHECSILGTESNSAQYVSWDEEANYCITKIRVWVYFEDVYKWYTYQLRN